MRRISGVLCLVGLVASGCASLKPAGQDLSVDGGEAGDVVPMEAPPVPANGRVEVGQTFADFTAPELTGGEIRLSSYVGQKVMLLQFWGIRCAPCLAEMEFLEELQKRYGGRGLQVMAVNTDRLKLGQLAMALKRRGINPAYPIVLDADFSISKRYTQWLIPVTVLIDRQGLVRVIHTGYKPSFDSVLEAEVQQLLEER